MPYTYSLENLFVDQDADYVVEVLPATLSWLEPSPGLNRHIYELRLMSSTTNSTDSITITWDEKAIAQKDPRVLDDLDKFRRGKTIHGEDQTKLAGYGLALAAISCILDRRIVRISKWAPPDLLLDETPKSIRGVEVAGRSSKGYAAFRQTLEDSAAQPKTPAKAGKRTKLRRRADVVEGYISLWCREPLVSWWEQVKP